MLFSPDRRFDECLRFQKESGLAHLRCCPLPAILASPFIFNKVSLLESHDRWWLFRVGHTDHLSGVCPNEWTSVSLTADESLLPYPCACSVTSTSYLTIICSEIFQYFRIGADHLARIHSCPPDVKSWTTFFTNKFEKSQKNKPYKVFSRFRTDLSLVGFNCFLYMILS